MSLRDRGRRAKAKNGGNTLTQLVRRTASSKFAPYLQSPKLDSLDAALRGYFAHRENIKREGEGESVLVGRDFILRVTSPEARVFANTLVANMKTGAESLGYELCDLQPIVINGLPGGTATPAADSAAVGVIREDGLVSPVVFSHKFILTQGDGTFHAGGYDVDTNFEALFRDQLTPKSFV